MQESRLSCSTPSSGKTFIKAQAKLFDAVVRQNLQQSALVAQMIDNVGNNSVSPAQVDLSVEGKVVPIIRAHEADAEGVPQGYKETVTKRSYLAVQLERSPAAKELDACFMKSQQLPSLVTGVVKKIRSHKHDRCSIELVEM